ncbi:MAG: 50S ribosome-binding GTPase [Phycisphaerae bacterium]|nr:50S ribosome-binding GTPase [Phycisphaerae bacterium]
MTETRVQLREDTTYAAVLTPIGAAGIAVIRLVGPEAVSVVGRIFRPFSGAPLGEKAQPGRVTFGQVVDGDRVLDDVVLTRRRLAGYAGFERGEVVEINPHGGVRVVQRILGLLCEAGASLTAPEAIGLAGWAARNAIEPEVWLSLTRAQTHRAAMWLASQQVVLPALLGDLVDRLSSDNTDAVAEVTRALCELRDRYEPARRLVEGAGIVIAGAPNAGKSTLANLLFGRPRSLVTEQPGTTRDWVAEPAAIEGIPLVLVDTAGLRPTEDPLERASIERALGRLAEADLALLVVDRSVPLTGEARFAMDRVSRARGDYRTLLVLNKADLPNRIEDSRDLESNWAGLSAVSALTGEGVEALGRGVADALGLGGWSEQTPGIWTARQLEAVTGAIERLPHYPEQAGKLLRQVTEMCPGGLI